MKIQVFLFCFLAVVLLSFRFSSKNEAVNQKDSVVEWLTETTHDFGDIPHKKPAKYHFQFRNVSGEPLLIDNVRPSCGCTVPDWDAAAVPADSIGAISVEYDAHDLGYFNKKVKVYFNEQRRAEVLFIEGWVE